MNGVPWPVFTRQTSKWSDDEKKKKKSPYQSRTMQAGLLLYPKKLTPKYKSNVGAWPLLS